MIDVRPFAKLGGANHGWLNAKHHFSFASYSEPSRMGWGALRVWNDDEIAAGTGFPPHPHSDMEIITYVRDGAISHEDSLGNKGRTVAGDVQVMSAGSGIRHAEYNAEKELTRIFQIWIIPDRRGGAPSWGARPFPKGDRSGRFVTLASGRAGESAEYALDPGRRAYLVPAAGAVEVNGVRLEPRDGAAIRDEARIAIKAIEDAEVVLVDVAA